MYWFRLECMYFWICVCMWSLYEVYSKYKNWFSSMRVQYLMCLKTKSCSMNLLIRLLIEFPSTRSDYSWINYIRALQIAQDTRNYYRAKLTWPEVSKSESKSRISETWKIRRSSTRPRPSKCEPFSEGNHYIIIYNHDHDTYLEKYYVTKYTLMSRK